MMDRQMGIAELPSVMDTLTPRSISCAVLIGFGVCLANMYFGLQAGLVSAMPMQSALLAFALFRSMQSRLSRPLSPTEATIIEVIAGSVGLAPFAAGFTSFIPALEFLVAPDEGGRVRFSLTQLLLWAVATCGLGIVAGTPFRKSFIFRQKLLYPSATATGTLIGVLFTDEEAKARAKLIKRRVSRSRLRRVSPEANPPPPADAPSLPCPTEGGGNGHKVEVLLISLAASAIFTLLLYFVPVLRRVPLFGLAAAEDWLWAFDMSPAYIGYGIIIGPSVSTHMIIGTVIGWGILSPIAKHNGWAPGPVGDFDTGARGWLLWVAMGFILGDTFVGLVWLTWKPLCLWLRPAITLRFRMQPRSASNHERMEHAPLLRDHSETPCSSATGKSASIADDDWPRDSLVPPPLLVWTGLVVVLLYLLVLQATFRERVSVSATLAAVVLIPLTGLISMRALGETDTHATLAIGRLAQLVMSFIVLPSNPKYTTTNLLLGGAVESGGSQASQQMSGFRTAYMTRTAPRAVFYGQMIGSYAGALIAAVLYKLYTTVNEIPNEEFSIPDSHLFIVACRLMRRSGLPAAVMNFALGAFMIGALCGALRILGAKRRWRNLVPSGVALAIGMYIVPGITLPRALGSLILVIGPSSLGIDPFTLICSATGLILGQGLFSLVTILLDALHFRDRGAL